MDKFVGSQSLDPPRMKSQLIHSGCRKAMKQMPAESVDSIVTDPPYGLQFMGKGWDHGVRFNFIGIDKKGSYVEIARARIKHAVKERKKAKKARK